VDKRWFVAIPVACAALALGIWAGGDEDPVPGGGAPTSEEMAACLEGGGAADTQVYEEEVGEVALAVAPAGDVIVLANLPNPDSSARAERLLRRKLRAEGIRGAMLMSTVNSGFTLVGVIGREGVDAGVPTLASEELAKKCASQRGASGARRSEVLRS
jgi:hypothetical protein